MTTSLQQKSLHASGSVLVAAGGTGGHVFPALAVAEKLRESGVDVQWLGTRRGIESRVAEANGFAISFIAIEGVRGKNLLAWLKAPFLVLASIWSVLQLIKEKQVAVVLGMGGYVSLAAGLAAVLSRKPLVLQEQNAIPGTTNRILAPMARAIFTGFKGVFAGRKNARWSGNPLRDGFCQPVERHLSGEPGCFRLLILGGSLGAQALNTLLPESLRLLQEQHGNQFELTVLHQTGESEQAKVEAAYRGVAVDAEVCSFIEDMPGAYRDADLVIARAGALTVSEIAAIGVASIFVPFPYAIDDHQTANARVLSDAGAAVILQQQALDAEQLAKTLERLLEDRVHLRHMAEVARSLGRQDAAQQVADTCRELIHA